MEKNLEKIKLIFQKKGFKYKDRLGNGGYGDVYIFENNNRDYAIKIQMSSDKKKKEKIKNECVFSKSLNSINLVKTYAIYQDKLNSNEIIFSMVMEKTLYMDMKYFFDYLLNGNLIRVSINNSYFPWLYLLNKNTIIYFVNQIFEGLKLLYECNCVHRDIKAENILIAYLFIVKICDFGIASKGKRNFKLGSSTWCYQGPEYYMNDSIIERYEDSFKIDYFSVGLIIYNLLFRKNVIPRDLKNTINLSTLKQCLNEANENIKKHEYDEETMKKREEEEKYLCYNKEDEIMKFDERKKVKDSEIKTQFIDKGIGELTRSLIKENISDRPNIFQILENESLNKNKKRIKKIYDINQFLEIKLFVEFQKPIIHRIHKKKYKI